MSEKKRLKPTLLKLAAVVFNLNAKLFKIYALSVVYLIGFLILSDYIGISLKEMRSVLCSFLVIYGLALFTIMLLLSVARVTGHQEGIKDSLKGLVRAIYEKRWLVFKLAVIVLVLFQYENLIFHGYKELKPIIIDTLLPLIVRRGIIFGIFKLLLHLTKMFLDIDKYPEEWKLRNTTYTYQLKGTTIMYYSNFKYLGKLVAKAMD